MPVFDIIVDMTKYNNNIVLYDVNTCLVLAKNILRQ